MVTILTSAVGLGLYIPALLIERQLRARQIAVEVEVLEAHYTANHQRAHLANRDAHHASFALAQLAHRMARGVEHCFDEAGVEALLSRWRAQDRRRFIVWAGFWLPLLKRYRAMLSGKSLHVDRCRIDAVVSASFKVHPDLDVQGREVWLWNASPRRLVHEIPVGDAPPIPFTARADRIVVHGGGWGIGTYREVVPALGQTRYGLDLVIHDVREAPCQRNGDRALMLDPSWKPMYSGPANPATFPPMIEMSGQTPGRVVSKSDYHALHDAIRASKAIVSKPGGCTLIDSLAAATPVVLLEPYGYAEESNAALWEYLGFGISYAAWRETDYAPAVLARLQANILNRTRGIDYPASYAEQLLERCA